MKVRTLATGLLLALLCAAKSAHAQSAPKAVAATSTALPLQLELGNSKLDPEAVRKAIELELKRPVVLAAASPDAPSLTVIAATNRTVTVSYRTSTGEVRTRSIGIPEDGARGAEVIALLSGNLSRDEAAELLADLAAKAAPPAESAAESGPEATPEADTPAPPPDATPPPPTKPAAPAPAPSPPPKPSAPPLIQTPFPAVNLSLWAPIALYPHAEQRIFSGELGLVYSHVGELRGIGLNLLVLRTERDVHGVSLATVYDETKGTVVGISGSGLISRRQGLRGIEFSGLINVGTGETQGVSAAGLLNLGRDFAGVQAAGLMNRADALQGVQAAGLLNFAKSGENLQVAGLLNWARDFQGVQVAGLVNRATEFKGVQVSSVNSAQSISGVQLGVVNVAGEVDGAQLGVVNVAKHVKGASVGLVSVAGNGRVQPVLWASTAQLINVAAKFTVGAVYTQAGLGYESRNQTYTYELGIGAHLPIGRLFVEPGLHYSEMRWTKDLVGDALLEHLHYRVAVGADLGRISPFGGAAIMQPFARAPDAPEPRALLLEAFGGVAFF